jgi:hypothetical protein
LQERHLAESLATVVDEILLNLLPRHFLATLEFALAHDSQEWYRQSKSSSGAGNRCPQVWIHSHERNTLSEFHYNALRNINVLGEDVYDFAIGNILGVLVSECGAKTKTVPSLVTTYRQAAGCDGQNNRDKFVVGPAKAPTTLLMHEERVKFDFFDEVVDVRDVKSHSYAATE